ncbi:hypothetical protein ACFX1Z_019396 [Malus domestica]
MAKEHTRVSTSLLSASGSLDNMGLRSPKMYSGPSWTIMEVSRHGFARM